MNVTSVLATIAVVAVLVAAGGIVVRVHLLRLADDVAADLANIAAAEGRIMAMRQAIAPRWWQRRRAALARIGRARIALVETTPADPYARLLVAHSPAPLQALLPAIDWYRNEAQPLSRRWWFDRVDRIASHPRLDRLFEWASRHGLPGPGGGARPAAGDAGVPDWCRPTGEWPSPKVAAPGSNS